MRMEGFKMRYQAGSERFVDITGETATLAGGGLVNMDSVSVVFFRDNLEFLSLTARSADARTGVKDSGTVTLSGAAGRLYYGGQFRAETLKLSFDEGTWRSTDSILFQRPPLTLSAGASYGPLSMEEVYAKDANIHAEGSTASGDLMVLWPRRRLLVLRGKAAYVSDTASFRADTLTLQIDPTYSRLTPAKPSQKSSQGY